MHKNLQASCSALALWFFATANHSALHAAGEIVIPFVNEEVSTERVTELRHSALRAVTAADAAFAQGFTEAALRLYVQAFGDDSPLTWEDYPAKAYNYSLALLIEQHLAAARQFLGQPFVTDSPRWLLRRLLLEIQIADFEQARVVRDQIDPTALPAGERRWLHLADGWLASRRGQWVAANDAFARMIAASTGPAEVAFAELMRDFEILRSGRTDESTIAGLRSTERSMQGRRGGFEAARLLAIALYQLDRRQEAMDVLERQLRLPAIQELGMREQFLFLMGQIAGAESLRGRLALQQLLRDRTNEVYQRNALFLLTKAAQEGNGRQELIALLDELIGRPQSHPLLDLLLHTRATLQLSDNATEQAEADWLQLLEQFPGSAHVRDALRGLAISNWLRQPPRFRVSADYWNRLRQQLPPGRDRDWTIVLMADAFFSQWRLCQCRRLVQYRKAQICR
ncbi:MAG: hypothetical protein LR015_08315 [Verrucomicrobia bacterium]|nr:hypothetical protein [Verrucomicrobiota bacterium]